MQAENPREEEAVCPVISDDEGKVICSSGAVQHQGQAIETWEDVQLETGIEKMQLDNVSGETPEEMWVRWNREGNPAAGELRGLGEREVGEGGEAGPHVAPL